MATKKTIAILGAAMEMGTAFAYNLARYNFRFLLLDPQPHLLEKIKKNIRKHIRTAETNVLDCSREGGWEADIILIASPSSEIQGISEKISEVATRKTVLHIISETDARGFNNHLLDEFLPNSSTATVIINSIRTSGTIYGENKEAIEDATYLLTLAGFHPYVNRLQTERHS